MAFQRKETMPRFRDEISLQTHNASGQFCKCIGKYLGRDGKSRPKIWYLSLLTPTALKSTVLALAARPTVARPNGKSHRMSKAYLRATINTLRWFCQWLGSYRICTSPTASRG
jgi:hypothetical protein